MSTYTDYELEGDTYRLFEVSQIQENELEWHRDKGDRVVTVLEDGNWYFQFDNGLPFRMTPGLSILIKDGVYHRIHKGDDDLIIKIKDENV